MQLVRGQESTCPSTARTGHLYHRLPGAERAATGSIAVAVGRVDDERDLTAADIADALPGRKLPLAKDRVELGVLRPCKLAAGLLDVGA